MIETSKSRYQFAALERHSQALANETESKCAENRLAASNTISFLGSVFETVEQQPKSLFRNVRLMLIARFMNHLYSMFLLVERGLFLDAHACARAATESTAFYWMICIDQCYAEEYIKEQSPRPVEVRKELEKRGVDVKELKDIYSHQSEVVHVGNSSDQMQVRWHDLENGEIGIGGRSETELQRSAFNAIVASMVIFLRYDPDFKPVERSE
ncbi:hypothetical protein [Planktomarina sp.]|uniref:hypothetical protein n=1 Tax=Planktomarina sp. TaxID=2024851 RepID=UPI003C4833BF